MTDLYGVPRRRLVTEAWFWVVVVSVTFLVIGAASFGLRWALAGPKGELQAREQILSGDNRIRAYNHFFDQCASIQALESTLSASLDELASADQTNQDNIIRIQTNITGLRSQRARAVAEYNADASKNYTDGQFRSLSLPFQITEPFQKGRQITCSA